MNRPANVPEKWGDLLTDVPLYLGYKEVAQKWDCSDSAIRNYLGDCLRFGEWRYLPPPDIGLVRGDDQILPGWLESTIDNFVRTGPGNHTRGDERRGYTNGAPQRYTPEYLRLGVTKANEIRALVSGNLAIGGSADLNKIADDYGIKVFEVQEILDDKRFVSGGRKRKSAAA